MSIDTELSEMLREMDTGPFVVALKAKGGDYSLYVEAFFKHANGKQYLRHTTDIERAKRFARTEAEQVVEQVAEYRCTGRLERVP